MTITRLGDYGGPRSLYGSFAGKELEGSVKPSDKITRLGAYGGARQLYGDFAGKEIETPGGGKPSDLITRIGMYGGPRQLYESFAGKELEDIIIVQRGGSSDPLQKTGYKLTAAQMNQIKREDEELIAIISIIGEYL